MSLDYYVRMPMPSLTPRERWSGELNIGNWVSEYETFQYLR